jgi:Tripartite tricarboxylate transporter TctB family
LNTDHVAGAAFLALGIVVFSISADLPFGSLSAPSAGMMPKVVTALMMLFAALILFNAPQSPPLASVDWGDRGHAAQVVVITAVAVAAYQHLGFLLTMTALVFALLVVIERRNALVAAAYSIGLTVFAYWLFGKALKSPLERGIFWF